MYTYKINGIHLKEGESFVPGKINVFVGANNCGKTQLLKDMLAYITGTRTDTVILRELEIPYPETWEEMASAYGMEIVEMNQSKHLRHISPTFDKDPTGTANSNIESLLSSRLKNDQRAFRESTGAGLVSYLNTDNRLKLIMSQPVQPNIEKRGSKNVLETLYVAGQSSTDRVRECIRKIFDGTDVYFSTCNLGTIEFRVGHDFSGISGNSQEAFQQLKKYPLIDTQGDGLRSILGIVSAIISVKKPVVLIDEPEAFLHPPQAMQFGALISELVTSDQQIFIATHSADFLRGLLGATTDAVIIRLNREKDVTQANVLDSATLNKIVVDPLLSSSRVLEGMFYKGIVATEGDADAVFYQRLFQKVGASDEIHFVNAHNKQTLKKIVEPYKKLGVKAAMIADADVIRDKHEFSAILQMTTNAELARQIYEKREIILSYFQKRSKYEILSDLRNKNKELIERYDIDETAGDEALEYVLFDYRHELKKLRDEADELCEFKKNGRASLPSDIQDDFDSLWRSCADIGLFIVNVGELESWLCDYGLDRSNNKSKWIENALKKLYEIEYDQDKAVWRFVDELKKFFVIK